MTTPIITTDATEKIPSTPKPECEYPVAHKGKVVAKVSRTRMASDDFKPHLVATIDVDLEEAFSFFYEENPDDADIAEDLIVRAALDILGVPIDRYVRVKNIQGDSYDKRRAE